MIRETAKEYEIPLAELEVTPDKILKFINLQDSLLSDFSRDILHEFLSRASGKATIKGGFVFIESERIRFNKKKFYIDDIVFHSERVITPKLKKSDYAAIFVATAGDYFEDLSRRFISDGDTFTGFLIDSAASEIAEAAAEWVDKEIGHFVDRLKLKTTSRYSPGYCGWTVGEQHKLFSFLPQNFCGIKLTSSALMIPIKSVSGIIGIGKNVKKEVYECSICEDVNCYRRNK